MLKLSPRLLVRRVRISGGRQVCTLILLRHGQSEWNGEDARFSGWVNVPLTVKGRVQAVAAGQLLRSRGFPAKKIDAAFTSMLERADETCELALASMAGPDQHTWNTERIRRYSELNERHYGRLLGEPKTEEIAARYNRSMHATPPPLDPSHPHYLPPPAPTTESLADCRARAVRCFHESIAPVLFGDEDLNYQQTLVAPRDERIVIVVAHSATIRALMAHFDQVPDEKHPQLHVPNSVPILYRFEAATRRPISSQLQGAAGGSHARWLLSPENYAQVRHALQPGGMLTRALFDHCTGASMAEKHDGHVVTLADLEKGLRALIRASREGEEEHEVDNAVVSVAKKVIRELYETRGDGAAEEVITPEEFERRASKAADQLPQWWADPVKGRPRWHIEQSFAGQANFTTPNEGGGGGDNPPLGR
mmetsp:Transcript_57630/g.130587  ORF Transcript_57630/g.130587 Transcript_57630/m.130587 type:complete len:422 (-) Transcript_57630:129-1394(-)